MSKVFSIKSRVYYADTDAGGVVYHSRYLDFCERARTDFLRDKGIIQTELLENQDMVFVVRNLSIDFLFPAKLDDLLKITVEVKEIKGIRIKMEQKIFRESDDKLLIRADVNLTVVNKSLRPTKLPKELKSKLEN